MTYTELEDKIYDWAVGQVTIGIPIIWSNQNGPRPTPPFISLHIITYNKIGQVAKSMANDEGEITLHWGEDIPLSIQGFGEASREELETLRRSLDLESILLSLQEAGIAVKDGDVSVRDISESLDTDRERRWIFEPTFGIGQEAVDTVGYIEDIDITKEVNNG